MFACFDYSNFNCFENYSVEASCFDSTINYLNRYAILRLIEAFGFRDVNELAEVVSISFMTEKVYTNYTEIFEFII